MSRTSQLLLRLIDEAEMPLIEKLSLTRVLKRAASYEDKRMEDRTLVKDVSAAKNLLEVVFSTDDVKIYTVYSNDEWDVKYPYRIIFMREGKWENINNVAQTFDIAFLIYREYRHLGLNSQFSTFAKKMLGI